MNPKDAGFLQKNIEKLILGVAVLCLLVTAWFFLMGNPFPVEVGSSEVHPDEIEDRIARIARGLEQKLNSDETKLPDRPPANYSAAFEQEIAETPTTLDELTPLAQAGLDSKVVPPPGPPPSYDLPRPPIAESILTRKGHAVLSDDIRTRDMEALIKLVGNREPKDFTYVSVAATFDMDEWIERLQSGDKDSRVPSRWWNSMIGIAGVMLQRQELDEETGEWGNEVLIDPLPNQLAFKPTEQYPATTQQVKEWIQMVRANQEKVARPDFPQTRGNILWSPPNEDAQELDADGQRKLSRINSRIVSLTDQIERLQEQIIRNRELEAQRAERENVGRDRGAARTRRAPTRGADVGGGYGGDMGGAESRTGRRPTGGNRGAARQNEAEMTPEDRMQAYQQQLIEAKMERNELLGLEGDVLDRSNPQAMGGYGGMEGGMGGYGMEGGMGSYGMDGGMGGYGMEGGMGGYGGGMGGYDPYGGGYGGAYGGGGMGGYGPGPGATAENVPESRKIKVWAHDLSIEPGKTYRYRVVVAVLNPLHRQQRVAPEQKEENYDRIALGPDPDELATSPWSDPVEVDSEYYFFMVKGSAQTQTARVEVWRVYDGKWISEEFEVRPGDPIGKPVETTLGNGRSLTLDMNVGLVVVDLVQANSGGFGGGNNLRMLYLDPGLNRITERTIDDDRNNPDWIRLQNEKALEAELALSPGADVATRGF